jgi:hypothetical protein
MTYYVPDGNWTNNVVSSLGNTAVDVLNFVPNVDSVVDPAIGCQKIFTGTYKCGLGTTAKSVTVEKPADGKTARFDCAAEFAQCNDLKLTLTDDGKLTLTNTAGTTKLWDSVTAFGANGAFPANNKPLVDPMNAGNGTPNSAVDVGKGGGPGRRYKHNYLLAGQFLEAGQWIGSPTGVCRLMMGAPGAPNSLVVVKNIPNCDELDMNITVNTNTDATRLYTIPLIYNDNISKAGYVNNRGQLQLYPDTMTSYGQNFEQIGNYNSAGGVLKSFTGSSLEDCQSKCLSGAFPDGANDTQKCAGFIFDSTGARCNILDKTFGQQQRIISPTARYNVRQKGITGQDISCPTDITIQTADFWNDTVQNSTPMTTATKCGLANYTAGERSTVASASPGLFSKVQYKDANGTLSSSVTYADLKANPALMEKNQYTFKYMFENLQDKYNTLTGNLFSTKASLKANLNELEESKQNLADWTGEQLQNLEAMNEDRDLNMMSQNYRHILWSILAIIIIIGTIKMTKANAAA